MIAPHDAGCRFHIGPYAITAELGAGGMGVVYTSQDPHLKRQLAICFSAQHDNPEEKNDKQRQPGRA
jgi:hypothetical protein